jgi:hypothetical protein
VKLTPSALMARKHSLRHYLRPRDLITHQANQTSKPKIILFFFFRKLLEKRFLGRGGGGKPNITTKNHLFFCWKTFGKMFLEILALPSQNMAWYGHVRPRHCRVTDWHAFAFPWHCVALVLSWHGCCSPRHFLHCLFHGSPWHGHCNLCHCLGCPWLALPWHCLGSPWHALAWPRQPVACLG